MKFAALIVLAILGAANASLVDDLEEVKALIPVAEIKAVTLEYAASDAEFQRVIAYLRSDSFLNIVGDIHDTPEWQELVAFLDASGINIYGALEFIYNLLQVDTYGMRSARAVQRGFHDWANAVLALIPFGELRALVQDKLQTSSEFQELVARLKSEEFQAVVDAVGSNAEWQKLLQQGRDHGAPVDAWIAFLKALFSWA